MKLGSRVTKILKQLEVDDHKQWLLAHGHAWDLVNALLKEEEERVSKEIYGDADYEKPNWDLKKADQAGQMRIIKKLQQLFQD